MTEIRTRVATRCRPEDKVYGRCWLGYINSAVSNVASAASGLARTTLRLRYPNSRLYYVNI